MTVAERIRLYIEQSIPQGQPFKPSAFYALGLRPAIDQTLSRLARVGWIKRVTRGVYVRPLYNEWVGEVMPGPEAVAQVIAPNNTLQVNGAEACRQLQLSTQVPTRPYYLTNGPTRTVSVGALGITLKHVGERKLVLSGEPAGVALSALYYLGRNEATTAIIGQIQQRLPASQFQRLLEMRSRMPAWLANLFYMNELAVPG